MHKRKRLSLHNVLCLEVIFSVSFSFIKFVCRSKYVVINGDRTAQCGDLYFVRQFCLGYSILKSRLKFIGDAQNFAVGSFRSIPQISVGISLCC